MNEHDPNFMPDQVNNESVGCWVWGNVWLKMGIPNVHAKLLKRAARRLFKGAGRKQSVAAWNLLMCALAHIDEMEEMIARDMQTAEEKGTSILECVWGDLARKRLAYEEGLEESFGRPPSIADVRQN